MVKYVGLDNKWNSLCYHVATIHLLHSSETLGEIIKRIPVGTLSKYKREMLRPLALYAKVEDEEVVYELMKRCYDSLVANVISEYATHGYPPSLLIEYYYLPIVFSISTTSEFVKICSEINMPICELNTLKYRIEDVISTRPFAKMEYRDECIDLYINMLKFIESEPEQPTLAMRAWILEVFPNERDAIGAHAVFLYRDEGEWRVVDDASIICGLPKYIRSRFVARIAIKNISEELVRELEEAIGVEYHSMTRRVGNRYEFECRDPERVLRTIASL